jgi:hypothetical protein
MRTSKAPELPIVLPEDLRALIGLLLILVGVSPTLLTDNGIHDAFAALAIAVLLVVIAIVLAVETKTLLFGGSASAADTAVTTAVLTSTPSITRVIHMKTLHLGPDELLVTAKIGFTHNDSAATVSASSTLLNNASRTQSSPPEPGTWSQIWTGNNPTGLREHRTDRAAGAGDWPGSHRRFPRPPRRRLDPRLCRGPSALPSIARRAAAMPVRA